MFETCPAECCQTVHLELSIFQKIRFASQSDDPANGVVVCCGRVPMYFTVDPEIRPPKRNSRQGRVQDPYNMFTNRCLWTIDVPGRLMLEVDVCKQSIERLQVWCLDEGIFHFIVRPCCYNICEKFYSF